MNLCLIFLRLTKQYLKCHYLIWCNGVWLGAGHIYAKNIQEWTKKPPCTPEHKFQPMITTNFQEQWRCCKQFGEVSILEGVDNPKG